MMAVGAQGRLSAALAVAEANADRAEQIERDAANAQLQFAQVQHAKALMPPSQCVNCSSSQHEQALQHLLASFIRGLSPVLCHLCVISVASFVQLLLLAFADVHIQVCKAHLVPSLGASAHPWVFSTNCPVEAHPQVHRPSHVTPADIRGDSACQRATKRA